jgi:dihydrofolate reductase
MRKVTYSAAVSLDGYIAGPDEAIDWIMGSDDVDSILKEAWRGVDTILMGRRTWDFAVRAGGGGGFGGKIRTFVFSRNMAEAPKRAELVRNDAAGFVRGLKAETGGNIFLMGGGELASALIEGGAVDELSLSIHPLLLGGGVPLLRPMARRVALERIEARPIAKGCVYARYRVAEA